MSDCGMFSAVWYKDQEIQRLYVRIKELEEENDKLSNDLMFLRYNLTED